MCVGELGKPLDTPVQSLRCQPWWLADGGGLQVDGELVGEVGRQPAGPVGAREPSDGSQQCAVVIGWAGHLVVEAFVILRLDAVDAERDSLTDQDAGAGVAVVVGELRARHRDREAGCLRQHGELHLGLHLRPAAVTHRVVEVARELHEQLRVEVGSWVCIFDVEQHLPARAASEDLLASGHRPDRNLKSLAEKLGSALGEGSRIGWEPQPGPVAGDPAVVHQVCSAARTSISLTATRRSRVTM